MSGDHDKYLYEGIAEEAGHITNYYQEIANSLAEDFLYHNAGHIVKWELQRYYSLCDSDEVGLKKAIECVLEDYMTPEQYRAWLKEI